MRARFAVAAVVVAALAGPEAALAHVTLSGATPDTQSTVADAPRTVELRFDQRITVGPRSVQVFAADGSLVSATPVVGPDRKLVTVRLAGLSRGEAYTVRWRVVGPDGHAPSGVFTFGIGVEAPPPTAAVGARGATWKDDAVRWLLFAALALVIGTLAVRLLVLGDDVPQPLERRFHLVPTVAAMAAINLGIAGFVFRASNALQLPFPDILYGDLQPFAEKTSFGVAFLVMTVGLGVVATLLMVAWVFDLQRPRWWALGLAALLLSGLSLSGHQATEPGSGWATQLADWVHLAGAAIWAGGLVALAFLVWPVAPELRRQAFLGFSRLAVGVVGAMILAGAYLALVRLPSLSALWETSYGQLLALKVAIVFVALSWGGYHHLVVRPRLQAGQRVSARMSLAGEATVALAVLLLAAVLTNATPPPVESPATTSPQLSR